MVLSRFTLDIDARLPGQNNISGSLIRPQDPLVKNHHGSSSPNKQLIEMKLPMYAHKQVYIHNTLSMVSEFQTYICIYNIHRPKYVYIWVFP